MALVPPMGVQLALIGTVVVAVSWVGHMQQILTESEPILLSSTHLSHHFMESPKKQSILQKENTFIIRKTLRPSSAVRQLRIKESPDKKYRDGRKSIGDYRGETRPLGPATLGLSTSCWCLYDSNNGREIGFRQNYQREIASLTKIMTTLITIQAMQQLGLRQNLLVRVTDLASRMIGTTANLKSGSWIILKDLLYGTMLPSGNDAAYTLAEVVGFFLLAAQKCENTDVLGTVEHLDLSGENTSNYVSEFIRRMNARADELEMIHTRYSNPHGLQNAMNISSAKDLVLLSLAAAQNALFRQVMNAQFKRYEYFSDHYKSDKEVKRWYNTNSLLAKGWQGIKTGQTVTAGCCLASLKNGVYIVVLNCADPERRFSQTQKLYNWYVEAGEKECLTEQPYEAK